MSRSPHISLADLAAAGVRLRADDAATVAREVALRAARGELPGVPSPHVIRFSVDGEIHVEGPVASGREVERAARLLDSLLPGFDAPPELRVPGALRLVVARALGILDLPPYASLDDFAGALARFALPDVRAAIVELTESWRVAVHSSEAAMASDEDVVEAVGREPAVVVQLEPPELTISDIRRARRATRLTLADISERSRIPVDMLREFEWGYLAKWPTGLYGRTQIIRYSHAAGLDEKVVLAAALPLLEEWEAMEPARGAAVEALPIVEPTGFENTSLVKVEPQPLAAIAKPRRRRAVWAAAAAIPAMIAIGMVPAWLSMRESAPPAPAAPSYQSVRRPVARPEERPPAPVATTMPAGFSPAFATAGSAMFYHSGMGAQSAIMRADTGAQGEILRVTRIVDDHSSNFHARPSPDGESIAFDSDRDGERGVYIADADGSNVRRVSGEGFAAVPSWSPDGKRLAFVRSETGRPRVWNIWTLELDTGRTTRVTAHEVGQPWGAAWFPDGQWIAYSHEQRLVVRTLDGTRARTFPSPVAGRLVRTPAVSPDGRHVVFQVHRDGGWLLNVRTGRMRKVLDDPTAEEFTWSPDGRRVAYHSRRSGKWRVWLRELGDN